MLNVSANPGSINGTEIFSNCAAPKGTFSLECIAINHFDKVPFSTVEAVSRQVEVLQLGMRCPSTTKETRRENSL